MNTKFKPDELVDRRNKDGSITKYPVVGARLRIAHEENDNISINTELINFTPVESATIKATITTDCGSFNAFGAASASKDTRLIESLLELAETRAIARALRFAGYGCEFTGSEELSDSLPVVEQNNSSGFHSKNLSQSHSAVPLTKAQKHAIEAIATVNKWNPLSSCRKILNRDDLDHVDELSKDEASTVISTMKEAIAA